MIKNHLSRILGERRWTQTKLAAMTGIRKSTISDLYNEMAERISFAFDFNDICYMVWHCDLQNISLIFFCSR